MPPFSSITYVHVAALKSAVALAGIAVAAWWWRAERQDPRRSYTLRSSALIVLGALSLTGWWNFGRFHFSGGVFHFHEFFHYYLGAKYLPELGFTGLYDCAIAVDIDRGNAVTVSTYWVRDLTTNEMRRGAENLQHAAECKARFAPERWAAFSADTTWLFDHMTERKRIDVLTDHGYNPTPFWSVAGSWLANRAPISWNQMVWLAVIDPALIVLMAGAIWWAFGWEVLCLAMVWFGLNYPSRYNYVGGAFLRQDWLLFAVASLCFARRGRMWASGFSLVWSAMLRVFPAFIALGLVLKILQQCWQAKRLHLTRPQWQFAGGALLAVAILFPISLTVGGDNHGLSVWKAFATNSRKHLATPVTNNIGLPMIVSFEPSTRAARVSAYWHDAPWDAWKDQRHRVFAERRVIYWVIVAAFVVLLAAAVRREDDWVALVLGVGAIPILTDMASYYFCILMVFAMLWRRMPTTGIGLTVTLFLTSVIPALLDQDDERYTAISVVYLVFIVSVTAAFALSERSRARAQSALHDAPPGGEQRVSSAGV